MSGVSSIIQFMQMNPSMDNAGGFWEENEGKALVGYQYIPTVFVKATQVRFGNKYLQDSVFISINTFLDASQTLNSCRVRANHGSDKYQ